MTHNRPPKSSNPRGTVGTDFAVHAVAQNRLIHERCILLA
jgi:hypothetical protein